jgi:4'-phosphopantetheinyl transferase
VQVDAQNRESVENALLSPDEVQRARRYRSDLDRAAFIQRRAALRSILAGYVGLAPGNIAFSVNEFGKPSVIAPRASADLFFNASRSESVALIAVTRSGRIGIDIERLNSALEYDAVAARFFTANETRSLSALHSRDRTTGFFNAWTRKEAVVKAVGRGLSIPLDSFDVSLRPGEPPAILRLNVPGAASEQWHMHHLEPAAGYVAAVAVEGAGGNCRCWRWNR